MGRSRGTKGAFAIIASTPEITIDSVYLSVSVSTQGSCLAPAICHIAAEDVPCNIFMPFQLCICGHTGLALVVSFTSLPVQNLAVAVVQGAVEKVAGPKDLFQSLYHHFLCLADTGLQPMLPHAPTPVRGPTPAAAGVPGGVEGERVLCIRAMAAVYSKHAGVIGTQYITTLHIQ